MNKLYRDTPALYENDYDWNGFQWISLDDYQNSVLAFRRIAYDGSEMICVCNFQPVTRENYRIGVPVYGKYEVVFNSEREEFGGCGMGTEGEIKTVDEPNHNLEYSVDLTLPPLGVLFIKLTEKLPAPIRKSKSKMAEKKKAAIEKAKAAKAAKAAAKKAETVKTETKEEKVEDTVKVEEVKAEKAETPAKTEE